MTTTPNAKAFIEKLLGEINMEISKTLLRDDWYVGFNYAMQKVDHYINQHRSEWE